MKAPIGLGGDPVAERTLWNASVAASPLGDVLQCWEWGELKARTGWQPLHLAVREGNRHSACALLLRRPIPHTRRCLLYCPRGPVFDPARPETLTAILEQIQEAARACGAVACKIDPAVPVDRTDIIQELWRCGFSPAVAAGGGFGVSQPRAVMKVDLTGEEKDLQARFHPKWRYNIRLAARRGVQVRMCGREALDSFYDLLLVTAQRDGFRVRARSYFHDLYDIVVQAGLGALFMASVGDVFISGALVFRLGVQCWYVYGASDNEHRSLMPNHLLQWEIMRWARARGCTVYDMRGVSLQVDGRPVDAHLAGLNRFKAGFGARYVEYIGDWDLVLSPLWYAAFQQALPVVRKLMGRSRGAPPVE